MTYGGNARIGSGAGIFHSARLDERTSVMDGEQNGTQTQQDAQQQEQQVSQQQTHQQETQAGNAAVDWAAGSVADAATYEAQLAERDSQIAELEGQIAEASKNAETVDGLRAEIAALKEQGESDLDFKLHLAGCRNVKATRTVLSDHGGDAEKLKAADPWIFADAPAKQTGKTRLPNAGAAADSDRQLKQWRDIAGRNDEE